MKTCLKLYHHSLFGSESSGKDVEGGDKAEGRGGSKDKRKGRRINVELTAGGGGSKNKDRKERIKSKNKKLEEEREKRRVKEKAEREQEKLKKREQPATGANVAGPEEGATTNHGSIHPSRLNRFKN